MLGAYIVYGGLTVLFAYLFYNVHSMENWKNKRIRELQDKVHDKEDEILDLKYKIINLESANKSNTPNREYDYKYDNLYSIPKGTIEAVKYAMKKSHPDNGGNAEDFIKFKKAYEELTNN